LSDFVAKTSKLGLSVLPLPAYKSLIQQRNNAWSNAVSPDEPGPDTAPGPWPKPRTA